MLGALWGLEEGRGMGMGECLSKGRGSEKAYLGGLECLKVACGSEKVIYMVFFVLLYCICSKTGKAP